MRGLRRALLALAVLGFAAGAVPLALVLADEGGHQRELIAVTGPLIGWAFIGTGIYAWLRRPENRFGALMTAVGFSACLAGLRVSTEPWVFIVGLLFITSQWALLYHMLLAFPDGTLHSPLERLLVVAMYISAWVAHPVQVLFQDTTRIGLPENPLLVDANADLSTTLSRARFWVALVLIAALGRDPRPPLAGGAGLAATGARPRARERRPGDGAARGLVRRAAGRRRPGLGAGAR
jgi:hypothetical protein